MDPRALSARSGAPKRVPLARALPYLDVAPSWHATGVGQAGLPTLKAVDAILPAPLVSPLLPRIAEPDPGSVAALDSGLADDRTPLVHLRAQMGAEPLRRGADDDDAEVLEPRARGGHGEGRERVGAGFADDLGRRFGRRKERI